MTQNQSDAHFEFVPLDYGNKVQILAVLRPLTGKLDFQTSPDVLQRAIAARVHTLATRWRRRCTKLVSYLKVDPLVASYQYMQRCRPTMLVQRDNPRWCCNRRDLCPFCWARQVRGYWEVINRAFAFRPTPKGPVTEYDLVRRRLKYTVPFATEPDPERPGYAMDGLEHYDDSLRRFFDVRTQIRTGAHRRRDSTRLRKLHGTNYGLAETFYVQLPEGGGRKRQWLVEIRQLILLPRGGELPPMALAKLAGTEVDEQRVTSPRRRDVVNAVAWAFRYWSFLMYGSSEATKRAIVARRKRRLTTLTGRFYDRQGA